MKRFLFSAFFFSLFTITQAKTQDVFSNTWYCVDGLGRTVANVEDGSAPSMSREDALIGIFYYVWHGQHGTEIKDITALLDSSVDNPHWGDAGMFHWGGQPALGYYKGGDSFIISKHMQMLIDAGIDFYFFDVTNAFTYDDIIRKVMAEVDRRQSLGLRTPKLAFVTHSATAKTVTSLYNTFFSKPEYDKYWFKWEDKPLILVEKKDWKNVAPDIRKHFTARYSWAWQTGKKEWPWLANTPQGFGYTLDTKGDTVIEQVSVATAQHPYSKIGKSYHNGQEPAINAYGLCKETPYGYYFQEQWDRALSVRPKVVMVTQWNEWMAQRFIIEKAEQLNLIRPGAQAKIGETYFVDVYNQEFNRDIEPSAEPLIQDNYYLQLVSNIRRFKGVSPFAVLRADKRINIKGSFSQWDDVTSSYCDESGDCQFTSITAQKPETFERKTNDIVLCKVVRNKNELFFYVKSDSLLVPASAKTHWMTLFLNPDGKYDMGWHGYRYLVENGWLYRYDNGWQKVKRVKFQVGGKELMLSLNARDINYQNRHLDFKWVDNVPKENLNIMDFYGNGDVAPNGRFNYRY